MQLMQEGVQKTASYCASICAERVVSARREMQRRWAEERRELERIYGLAPGSGFGTPSSSRLNTTPRMALAPTSRQASRPGSCNSWSTPCQELPATSPLNEGAPLQAAFPSSKVDEEDAGQQNLDSSFIDAYDAVQTLEERNHQAARAMQLLDEALKAAETAGCGNHGNHGNHVHSGPSWHANGRPNQDTQPLAQASLPHRAPQAPWSLRAGQRHKGGPSRSSPVVTQFPGQEASHFSSKKPTPCPAPSGSGRSHNSTVGELREPSTFQVTTPESGPFANEQDRHRA